MSEATHVEPVTVAQTPPAKSMPQAEVAGAPLMEEGQILVQSPATTVASSRQEAPDAPTEPASMTRNVLANWVGQFVFLVCGFILPRLASDHIGQTHLGIWDFGWSLVGYLNMLHGGVASSVTRFVARYRAVGDWRELNRTASSCAGIFGCGAVVGTLITIGTVVTLPLLPEHIFADHIDEAQWTLAFLGMSAVVELLFTVYNGVISGHERYDLIMKIEVLCNVAKLGAIVAVLMVFGLGVEAMAVCVFAVCLLEGGLKTIVAHRLCPRLRLSPRLITKRSLKDVVSFGGKSFLYGIARITLYQGNNILITMFLGPASLALFARALALVVNAEYVVYQFARVLVPVASGAQARNDDRSLANLVLKGSQYSNLIALPLVLMLAILGPTVIRVWMGAQYAVLPLITVLAFGHMASLGQGGPLYLLQGMNRHGRPGIGLMAAGFVSIIITSVLLGVFHLGLMGVAYSVGISLTLLTLLVTPRLVAKAIGISTAKYLAQSFAPCWLVIPFALWLVLCRIVLADQIYLQLLCGVGGGGIILLLSYWKTLVPDEIKEKVSSLARLGRRT